ncbi:MAG: putative Diadenosine tetraphosphate (Ap4A) hydrolase [Caulobacteraceae bacterium]|nr:putative Diadenosine tetraphosphate (Ap4A) hydrolase [Caulobacteraceae bacterium]
MRARSRPARGALQGWAVITPDYALAPALAAGSAPVAGLPLCDVRLQLDARFPWLILIPRVAGARELEDLTPADRARLMDEIVLVGQAVRAIGEALGRPVAKLNVGALGNITPQLHVHVVGRRPDDAAWPGPVWGAAGAVDYEPSARRIAIAAARLIGS